MRKFLKNILLFCCFLLVYLTLVFTFNFYNENYPKIPKANILFLGDSHIKYQVNPDSFVNANNYGHSGDVLIGLKWKIHRILKNKNRIDTIIISLGYHNFREFYPKFFNTKVHDAATKNITRYLFINNWYFLKKNEINKFVVIKSLFDKIKKPAQKISYLGYFIEQHGQINDSSRSSISRLYTNNQKFNQKVIYLIQEIVDFCVSKKVKCFFIFPPTHPTYTNKVPEEIKTGTDKFIHQFSQTPYFIPVEFALDDSLFFDGDHLNAQGAQLYTHSLKQALYNNRTLSNAKL